MATDILLEGNASVIPLGSSEQKAQITSTIRDMLSFTKELVVNSEVSYKKVTSLYRQARDWKKSIEAKRKEMTEPLRKQVSEINDKANRLTDPLDSIIALANAKANGYQRMLEEQRILEEEKIRAAAALFDVEEEIYIAPMEKVIRGDGAVAVTKTEKKFKVMDISKVPLRYLMVDEKAIAQDIKLGINDISGIEIYEETTTQLRIR